MTVTSDQGFEHELHQHKKCAAHKHKHVKMHHHRHERRKDLIGVTAMPIPKLKQTGIAIRTPQNHCQANSDMFWSLTSILTPKWSAQACNSTVHSSVSFGSAPQIADAVGDTIFGFGEATGAVSFSCVCFGFLSVSALRCWSIGPSVGGDIDSIFSQHWVMNNTRHGNRRLVSSLDDFFVSVTSVWVYE